MNRARVQHFWGVYYMKMDGFWNVADDIGISESTKQVQAQKIYIDSDVPRGPKSQVTSIEYLDVTGRS